jgi:hypothetical protein
VKRKTPLDTGKEVTGEPFEKTTIVSYVSGQKEKLAINFFMPIN